jgi:hypothetical protein
LVVKKEVIYSGKLREDDDAFYSYFVKQLMKFDGGALADARIRIDGSGDREFRRALSSYLRKELKGKIKEVRMADSARDPLTQLADMCVGAVGRAYRDRPNADVWLKMLRPRIADIWEFK